MNWFFSGKPRISSPLRIILPALAVFCLLSSVFSGETPEGSASRPWAFNWWLGSAVDKDNLARELRRYRDAGLGGVHVIPIYGVRGAEHRALPYLSPEWMEAWDFVVKEGERLGLGVDLTTGTGWCFGGPGIGLELGGRRVVVERFPAPADGRLPQRFDPKRVRIECVRAFGPVGESLPLGWDSENRLSWRPPGEGWHVVALGHESTGTKVKRPAPGGAGLMINPFDPDSMRTVLGPFSEAFDKPGVPRPRAMYHDSYEYYGADWSSCLLEAFAARRGFRLEDELEAFAGYGDPERVARVRCDYRETLSDLLIEEVFPIWTAWCRGRGILTRNQAHGAPGNLLDFYALADIPETEMFGHGGPDPLASGFDENLGKADRDPLVSKFASSAAHVSGKQLVSAETGTWLAEHFCETLEELKGLVDLLFLSGVNHVFFHGCAYSPDDAAWPGWLFYAATQVNPRNPLWREIPTLNAYIDRCQSTLRAGRADNDLLLYWPVHDLWTQGKTFQFTVHKREWLTHEPFGVTARWLWEKGYGFDAISDRLLKLMDVEDRIEPPGGPCWFLRAVGCRRRPFKDSCPLPSGEGRSFFKTICPRTCPDLANWKPVSASGRGCWLTSALDRNKPESERLGWDPVASLSALWSPCSLPSVSNENPSWTSLDSNSSVEGTGLTGRIFL